MLKGGWTGTILRVELGTRKVVRQALAPEVACAYIGGRGLNLKILYDELLPGTDPLDSENRIIFGAGPCDGTLAPGSTRVTVTAKSPLTGLIGDGNLAASLGPEMKYAGYDAIVFHGKSHKPAYLWIDDDRVELRDAAHLWGKTTRETERIMKEDLGDPDICTVSIGPAGENLVRFASVTAKGGARHGGRGGMGAVMGSKRLKAIAVRGTKGVSVSNPALLEETMEEIRHLARSIPMNPNYAEVGTPSDVLPTREVGIMPVRNYQTGTLGKLEDYLSTEEQGRYVAAQTACFSCPESCSHLYVVQDGPYLGTHGEGLEFSSFQQLGPRIGNRDLDFMHKLNTLCGQYGIDSCDFGGVVGFTMECCERGILSAEDTNGLRIEWGDHESIVKLMEMIVQRKGFGNILAEGLKRSSETIGKGSEKYALHVKGMGFSTVDPRGSQGYGLQYAVASRGACHVRAAIEERFLPYAHKTEHKGELVAFLEHIKAVLDSLNMCIFSVIRYNVAINRAYDQDSAEKKEESKRQYAEVLTKLLNSITGAGISSKELLRIGERIVNLERLFNLREGFTVESDTLPDRFLKEPLPEGPSKGQVVRLDPMLDEYYESRGWDRKTGIPSEAKLTELGLKGSA